MSNLNHVKVASMLKAAAKRAAQLHESGRVVEGQLASAAVLAMSAAIAAAAGDQRTAAADMADAAKLLAVALRDVE